MAQTVGLNGLRFAATQQEVLSRLLRLSGADVSSLRERAEEPAFLAGILDFLLADENLLAAFCETESLSARDVHLAAAILADNGCA